MSTMVAALLAAQIVSAVPAPAPEAAQDAGLYRVVNVRAAPGRLAALIELQEDRAALLEAVGEHPGYWMRHSQGDHWDLMLIQPIESMASFFAPDRLDRVRAARSPRERTGAQLAMEIDDATAWREELFAAGPSADVVDGRFDGAGLFHIEMFVALAGKREELVREREMENVYLEALDRDPNLIFTRVAGAQWDSFTVGFYEDLMAYAQAGDRPLEDRQAAATLSGFGDTSRISTYLRELIASHHDTLATRAF